MVAIVAEDFETHRPHLLAVGYRLTGSVTDAEDAVQEAWLRLSNSAAEEIRDLRAWLTTVVGRICLDRLRSAAVRRESYVGQWLPEPFVTPLTGPPTPDPLDSVVQQEDSRFAAMVVLDSLSPPQRVAFVLHDAFDVPFDEIAQILDISVQSARQLASRARRTVASTPPPVDAAEHEQAIAALMTAMANGDINAVVAALDPDAVMIGDAGGTTRTAVNVVHGADKIARFLLGLIRKYGEDRLQEYVPVRVNGQLGFYTPGSPGDADHPPMAPRVMALSVRDGKVVGAFDIANPAKLHGLKLA
ncbi:sigma-70 family RNA polymerase sigma factor [Skermania sp. ID1734]|uniref:sigma-70 family RNA polymerase sigma factor n=1 Tax=Skermania sp. ID1734 TaxID=2597516 RepID=UPI0011816FDA|nr:sigma-70 family RNA polymerase sigma factor [Skermania sp. ID1734]TSD96608.1 sigma-70 family RNA polymerase sigma factor [Skermania sp. ID1734]